jgi:hypothetical protein
LRTVILVPPSEAKAPGGDGPPWHPGSGILPSLDADRRRVLRALGAGVAKAPTLPAIERYTGVLHRELAWSTLPPAAKRRGRASLLVVSGLWGVVAPDDPIPHYRLKMSASLSPLGRLSTWWRPRLTAALAQHLEGALVWDLLPIEHAAAWDPVAVPSKRRVRVRVVDREGRTVGHWNKLVKGALVRRLLVEGAGDPAAFDGWEHGSGSRVELEER